MRATEAGTLRVGVYMVESARPGAMTTAANDGRDDDPRPEVVWRVQVLNRDECAHGKALVARWGGPRRCDSRRLVAAGLTGIGRKSRTIIICGQGHDALTKYLNATHLRTLG
jgi:hypothetical protein